MSDQAPDPDDFMSPRPGETDEPINPVQIEAAIRNVANRIARGVKLCSLRYAEKQATERAYTAAYAKAFLDYSGPANAKRYAADLATIAEREARDVADVAYRYADRQAEALQDLLRAYQSLGANTRSMYAVAGRGEH